jgi:hypothetical protein
MGTDNFNINRLYLLIQRQLVVNKKNLLIAFAACFGTILTIFLLTIYSSGTIIYQPLIALSFVVIYVGGFIFTSIGFNELHTPDKAYQYLTLPATTLEKLSSVWLLTSIIYIAVSLVIICILALIGNLFAIIIGVGTQGINSLFQFPILNLVWIYLVAQTIFLLGSCYFRKNNFLKTLLTLFVVCFALSIYTGINGWIFFGTPGLNISGNDMNENLNIFFQYTFPLIVKVVFYYLIAPFFLLTSFFVLKERQV